MLSDICLEDVVDSKPNKSWTHMDYLSEVARVASLKYDKEKPLQRRRLSLVLRPQQRLMKKQTSPKKKPIPQFLHIPKNQRSQRLIKEKAPKKPINALKKPINLFLDIPNNERLANDQKLIGKKSEKKRKNNGHKNKTKDMKLTHSGLNPPPDMPIRMRNRIGEIGGSNIILVIQKGLFSTDLSKAHNRLSMPINEVKSEFLTDDEKARLKIKQGKKWMEIEALLIDPELNEFRVKLKRWEMERESAMYVFVNPWNKIVKENNFEKDEVIQVWAFRSATSELCFAMVKVGM